MAVALFFSTPPSREGPMAQFFNGMLATKYFFYYLLKGTATACGLLLLSGWFGGKWEFIEQVFELGELTFRNAFVGVITAQSGVDRRYFAPKSTPWSPL